jgi:drug/metabolite transporter (DMT)-like permease
MSVTKLPASGLNRWSVLAAFAAIYFVWGSSYVFIHFGVETIPPFLLGGVRFTIAGLLMMGWARTHGAAAPTRAHWRAASIAGFMMFLINNGAIIWASQYVPSGLLALLIAATPLWMVLFDWWRPTLKGRQTGGIRPNNLVFAGLLLGLVGVALLVNPAKAAGSSANYMIGILVVFLLATSAWAGGSIYTRQAQLPDSPILCTGMQLFTGGLMLLALSVVTGETNSFTIAQVSARSALSVCYLIMAGSIIGFGSYIWLLRVSNPARVATYAYVNPIVAVGLGWALAGEPINERTLLAAAVIIAAVMLVNTARTRKPSRPAVTRTAEVMSESSA